MNLELRKKERKLNGLDPFLPHHSCYLQRPLHGDDREVAATPGNPQQPAAAIQQNCNNAGEADAGSQLRQHNCSIETGAWIPEEVGMRPPDCSRTMNDHQRRYQRAHSVPGRKDGG